MSRLGMVLTLAFTASAASAQTVTAPIKPGEDFCFARIYDAKHLAAHPKQIVSSIEIMGRNAWKGPQMHANGLYASLQVRFRDTAKLLVMQGVCRAAEGQPAGQASLTCKFFPDRLQDVLASQIRMEWPRAGVTRITASGDWKVLRNGKEPDGEYGVITTDDRTFDLERRNASSCNFSKIFWSAKGATKALIQMLP